MNKDIYSTLKFRIGEELRNISHEVIPIPPLPKSEGEIHPYEYFGEINEILNLPASRIVLFFRAQVIVKVLIVFDINLKTSLIEMLENLDIELPNELHLSVEINKSTDCIELIFHSGI